MGEHPVDKVFREALNEVPTPPPSPAGWAETLSAVKATGAIGTVGPLATITGKIIAGSIVVATVATTAVLVSSDEEPAGPVQLSEQVIGQDEQSSDASAAAQYEDFLVSDEPVSEELEGSDTNEHVNMATAEQSSAQEEAPTAQTAGLTNRSQGHSLPGPSEDIGDANAVATSSNAAARPSDSTPLNSAAANPAAMNDPLGSDGVQGNSSAASTAPRDKNNGSDPNSIAGSDVPLATANNSDPKSSGTEYNDARPIGDERNTNEPEDLANRTPVGSDDRTLQEEEHSANPSARIEDSMSGIRSGSENLSIAGAGVGMLNNGAVAERMEVLSRVINPMSAVQVMPYDSSLAKNLPPSPLQRFTILPYLSIDHSILDLGVASRYGGQNSTVLNLDANRQLRYTLGMRLIYNLNERISVQSGLYYVNKGRLSGSLGDMDGQLFTEFELSAEYMEIPLLVSYRIPLEGFGICLTTGAHLQKNLSSGSDLIREGDINSGVISTIGLNAASSGTSIIAAVGLDFRVSKNVYVLLEPSYRHSLNPVIQLENDFGYELPVDPVIHSFGLGTGLLIKLK